MANPIGLAVAAIAGGAYLIYRKWEKVGPWFADLWAGVQETFGGVADFVVGAFTFDMDKAVGGCLAPGRGSATSFGFGVGGIAGAFRWAWDSTIGPMVGGSRTRLA